jgi:RimJ/RimL family protein N-acetyltransferase
MARGRGCQSDAMPHPYWPLFDLRVRTPHVELRYPDDDLLVELVRLAARGVHDPAVMPFSFPWTDLPPGELERGSLQYHWRNRAEWSTHAWTCDFVVMVDGGPVGSQSLHAKDFATLHLFDTGSWLGLAHQGRGIGKEMRAAVLHLGFAGLGARFAATGAYEDNLASLGVTRSLGYQPNGEIVETRRGTPARQLRFLLRRQDWETRRRDDIEIEGLDEALDLFLTKEATTS